MYALCKKEENRLIEIEKYANTPPRLPYTTRHVSDSDVKWLITIIKRLDEEVEVAYEKRVLGYVTGALV